VKEVIWQALAQNAPPPQSSPARGEEIGAIDA
jgi:hypothetical protein